MHLLPSLSHATPASTSASASPGRAGSNARSSRADSSTSSPGSSRKKNSTEATASLVPPPIPPPPVPPRPPPPPRPARPRIGMIQELPHVLLVVRNGKQRVCIRALARKPYSGKPPFEDLQVRRVHVRVVCMCMYAVPYAKACTCARVPRCAAFASRRMRAHVHAHVPAHVMRTCPTPRAGAHVHVYMCMCMCMSHAACRCATFSGWGRSDVSSWWWTGGRAWAMRSSACSSMAGSRAGAHGRCKRG